MFVCSAVDAMHCNGRQPSLLAACTCFPFGIFCHTIPILLPHKLPYHCHTMVILLSYHCHAIATLLPYLSPMFAIIYHTIVCTFFTANPAVAFQKFTGMCTAGQNISHTALIMGLNPPFLCPELT